LDMKLLTAVVGIGTCNFRDCIWLNRKFCIRFHRTSSCNARISLSIGLLSAHTPFSDRTGWKLQGHTPQPGRRHREVSHAPSTVHDEEQVIDSSLVQGGFTWVPVMRPMTTIPKFFQTPFPRAITISPVVQTALQVKGQQLLMLQLHGSRWTRM